MELSTDATTSIKRKHVDGTSDSDEPDEKIPKDENEPFLPTLQSEAGRIQGPDDATISSLFSLLYYAINTFVQEYFKGSPYAIPRKNDQKVLFEALSGSECIAYLKSKHPGAKEAIVMAMVWVELIKALLREPTKAFVEEMPEIKIKSRTRGKH